MIRKLAFGLVAAIFVAMVLEGLSRLFLAGVNPSGFDDASWRTHWLRSHAERGELYYEFDVFDPRLGWMARPGLRDEPAFDGKVLNTNSLGLRGRTDPPLQKLSGTEPRILVLGDSFTFGEEVDDDETYSARLEEMLPGGEVLNFGVHGYGHDQMLLLFQDLGRRYRPDIVILGFVYPDIYRNLLSFRDYAKPRYVVEDGKLQLTGVPVASPEETLRSSWKRPRFLDAISMGSTWLEVATGRLEERARDVTRRLLDALVAEIRDAGGQPLFVYLPVSSEWSADAGESSVGEMFLLGYCETREIDCLSLLPTFRESRVSITEVPGQLHWGPGGHQAAARGIHDFIEQSPSFHESR